VAAVSDEVPTQAETGLIGLSSVLRPLQQAETAEQQVITY